MRIYDLAIIGAGAAGMPAAIFAVKAGASVVLVEAADKIGGTFWLSSGQMSAAGSKLQRAAGIADSTDAHYADVERIGRNDFNPALVHLAIDNAADTVDWLLDNGLIPQANHPIIYPGHEPYTTPRTLWGAEQGKSVLKVMAPLIEEAQATGLLDLLLSTKLTSLSQDESGAVTGVVIEDADGEREIAAKAVMLATGGYTGNKALSERLSKGRPHYGGGLDTCLGEGLEAAVAAGGTIVNEGVYLPIFAAVSNPAASGGYQIGTFTNPLYREPWEVFVDETGRRFYREDQKSCDVRETALGKLPGMRFWAIFDQSIRNAAPRSFFSDPVIEAKIGQHPDYVRADSLAELAEATGMNAAVLAETVAAYNRAIVEGTPDPLGREHRPMPLTEGPFYAVHHYGWNITSFAGIRISDDLRVVDADGVPIPNLFAAGEIIGITQTSGSAFCSGMCVTPAMTFGRLLGQRLGAELATQAEVAQ